MQKLSRRNFFIGAGTVLGTAGLASLLTQDPITQEEFYRVSNDIQNIPDQEVNRQHSFRLDSENTFYTPGSDSLVVYLPDIHTRNYADDQKPRIQAIDNAISLDAIGLEGIAGEINSDKIIGLMRKVESHYDANTIPTIVLDENIDYNISKNDSPEIRLQKLRVAYDKAVDWAYGGFWSNETFKRDRDAGNERYKLNQEFEVSLKFLFSVLPFKESYFGREGPLDNFSAIREFQGSDPRITAPGIFYADLETRAKKIGIEDKSNDNNAIDIADAHRLQIDISRIEHQLGESNRLFRMTRQQYGRVGTIEEQEKTKKRNDAYMTFANGLSDYVQDMIRFRDRLLEEASQETREAILECKYNPDLFGEDREFNPLEYHDLIIRQRSQDWIKTLSDYRTSMLIGGMGHANTVSEAAKKNRVSLISLLPLN